jgi:hypothetical protein
MATIRPEAEKERVKKIKLPDLHNTICLAAENFLKSQNFPVVFRDGFNAVTGNGERPDAIGFRSDTSCLIEVKTSRADFCSDKNKRFRADPSLGVGDWRFYLCPPGVINVEDLPEGWGLLYYIDGKIKKVHGWPPNTQWASGSPFAGRTNVKAERDIMYSALRRMVIHGHFKDLYNGLYGRCGLCDRLLKENFEEHPEHGRICKKSCP